MLKIQDLTIKNLKAGKFINELPDFYELKNIIENNHWHNNESTFTHTLKVLANYNKFLDKNSNIRVSRYLNKKVVNYKRKDLISLAIVLHDLGKKEILTKKAEISSFPEHEKISVLKSKKIFNKFKLSKKEKDIVEGIIKKHSDLHAIVEDDNQNLDKEFNSLVKSSRDYIVELITLVMTDTLNGYLKKTMPKKYKFRINFYKEKLKNLV